MTRTIATTTPLFREVQRFRQTWVLALVALLTGGASFILLAGNLRTEVGSAGVLVRYWPFQVRHRLFPYDSIASCTARTYSPVREYGGWGLRGRGNHRALNVSGNRGVQLVFHDGARLLLGSQRADELATAIEAARAGTGGVGFVEVQYQTQWFVWLLVALLVLPVVAIFWFGKLVTELYPEGLRIQYFPFHWRARHFPIAGLAAATARTYRPIAEYGGWGLRGWGRNRAWNVSGNRGVQLVFHDDRRLLLGSQHADELAAAVRSAQAAASRNA